LFDLTSSITRYFADGDQVPSRTTVGVAKLGRDALVEVDLVLYRRAAT
jgi:2-iminobutanoate/2-iminopropanoate deaminase